MFEKAYKLTGKVIQTIQNYSRKSTKHGYKVNFSGVSNRYAVGYSFPSTEVEYELSNILEKRDISQHGHEAKQRRSKNQEIGVLSSEWLDPWAVLLDNSYQGPWQTCSIILLYRIRPKTSKKKPSKEEKQHNDKVATDKITAENYYETLQTLWSSIKTSYWC